MKLTNNIYYLNQQDATYQLSKIDNNAVIYEIDAQYIHTNEQFILEMLRVAGIDNTLQGRDLNRAIHMVEEKVKDFHSLLNHQFEMLDYVLEFGISRNITNNEPRKSYYLIIKNYQLLDTQGFDKTTKFNLLKYFILPRFKYPDMNQGQIKTLFLIDIETQYTHNFLTNTINQVNPFSEKIELMDCLKNLISNKEFENEKGKIEIYNKHILLIDTEEIKYPLFIALHKMLRKDVYDISHKEFSHFLNDKLYQDERFTITDNLIDNLKKMQEIVSQRYY